MNVKANNLHIGSEDCTRPYMILGNECDLPHPLIFWRFHGEQVRNVTEPFIQKCKNLAKSKDLPVEVEDGLISLAWTAFSEDGSTNKVEYFYRAKGLWKFRISQMSSLPMRLWPRPEMVLKLR
jgi:hypothetical protein